MDTTDPTAGSSVKPINVYEVCRLCMNEISSEGINCLEFDELRLAIKDLYGVEVS